MSGPRQHPSEATSRAVERSAGELSTLASQRMEEHLGWYRDLSAEERSQVGLVAQAGISQFIAWFHQEESHPPSAISIFANAPQELTRSVSLRQTLDLVRTVVDVVESRVESLAGPGDEQLLRESVLRFSREIAFAAAEVYAGAAEARGAWDARLEALVVDAVLRGEADDSMQSRASALGWGDVADVTFVVGSTPAVAGARSRPWTTSAGPSASTASKRWRSCNGRASSRSSAARVRRRASSSAVADCFGPGPIVLGPTVPHLFAAGRSARAALSGLAAAAAWPDAPRVLESDVVLPERALAGDPPARRILVDRIHRPLSARGSRAAARRRRRPTSRPAARSRRRARALFVHPNTVRYRLGTHLRRHGLRPHDTARGLGRAHRPGPRVASPTTPAPGARPRRPPRLSCAAAGARRGPSRLAPGPAATTSLLLEETSKVSSATS